MNSIKNIFYNVVLFMLCALLYSENVFKRLTIIGQANPVLFLKRN